MTLVRYAGYAKGDRAPSMTADTMFRQGRTTLEIAQHFGLSEAKILRRVNVMRSRRLSLPSPYAE
jgi:DNA-binding transcriptional regulator LsrR (DeoR family)